MSLNDKQRSSLWMGIMTMAVMGAFPPWKEVGPEGNPASYAPIYAPPVLTSRLAPTIDFSRLILQWSIVGLVTGGMLATADKAKAAGESKPTLKVVNSIGEPVAIAPTEIIPPKTKAAVVPPTSPAPAAAKAKVRTLKFPDAVIGEILLESESDPDFWESVGHAAGIVTVPAGRNIQLEVSKDANVEFSALKQLDPHAIQSLDLSDTAVKDEDLAEIVHFNRLQEIDLSNTAITDNGLEFLSKIYSLKKIWLDHSKVTDSSLKKLTALQELEKLSFIGTEVTESAVTTIKKEFPSRCEIVMASGKTV